MVSRRKILSRSRDNLADAQYEDQEEEDVWYNVDKLYKDHIQEVLDKWNQIDDEIWAKVIVFERNRRVAKAYARAPVLTVNGSNDGFDGFRIGLCGFDNPMRDPKTEEAKRHINQGVKIKMDEQGNIQIKRLCKSNVYVKPTNQEDNAIGAEIVRNSQGALEHEKPGKLFDMNKFHTNLLRETMRAYPDRRRLETQCLSAIVFVRTEADILQCPVWVLIVNVVGLDMLKSKLPPVIGIQRPVDIKNRPRIPIPDEDPYSVAGVSSSSGPSDTMATSRGSREQIYAAYQHQQRQQQQHQLQQHQDEQQQQQHRQHQQQQQQQSRGHRRGERPPKLPPRENVYGHDIPKPDYDDIEDDYISSTMRPPVMEEKKSKKENGKKYDDPYYCGLRARVPNFVKMAKSNGHHPGVVAAGAAVSAAAVTPVGGKLPPASVALGNGNSSIYGHTGGGGGRLSQHHNNHHAAVSAAATAPYSASSVGAGHHQHHLAAGNYHQSAAASTHHQIYAHHAPLLQATAAAAAAVPTSAKHQRPPIMYHARSFESGLDSDDRIDSPYNHIYGRLPIPTRGMIPPAPRAMFIGEWD